MIWLGLYQSASIWLCVGPDLAPKLDRAAGADRRPAHRQQEQAVATITRGEDEERLRPRGSRHGL